MRRSGSKYQVGDRFIMRQSTEFFSRGETVEITDVLGKNRHNRTQVRIISVNPYVDVEDNPSEVVSVIVFGRRVKH